MLIFLPYKIFAYIPEQYSPYVSRPYIYPANPVPNSNTKVFVDIFDKFGIVKKAILSYSINDSKNWTAKEMYLNYGTVSNGTYVAEIPQLKQGTKVAYSAYFQDDLGYSANTSEKQFTVTSDVEKPYSLAFNGTRNQFEWEKTDVLYRVLDTQSGVKNITMTYETNFDPNSKIVELKRISGDEIDGTYRGLVGAFPVNTRITFHALSYDYAGNSLAENTTYVVRTSHKFAEIFASIENIDPKTLRADVVFNANGDLPGENASSWIMMTSTDSEGRRYDSFEMPVRNLTQFTGHQVVVTKTLYLIGNRTDFPFDNRYYLRLNATLPIKDADLSLDNSNPNLAEISGAWRINSAHEKISDKNNPQQIISISFDRNDTSYREIQIVIALMFFPLGAILLLGNKIEDLTNRLALAIGVFAFIFTLTPIIDSVKPLTFGKMSIADFSIVIALVAAISFMVFSVLYYRFKTIFIDIAAFGIVAAFAVFLLGQYQLNFPFWFIPLLIFELGFGLLIKIIFFGHKPKVTNPDSTVN